MSETKYLGGIHCIVNRVSNSKGTIIITHGFAEHVGRYDWLCQKFNDAQYNVWRYDVREHGDSIGSVHSYKDFVEDLKMVVSDVLGHTEGPIYTFGHSMGGLITALFGVFYGDLIDGQILSGPALGALPAVKGIKGKTLQLAGTYLPNLKIRNVVENDICSVPEVVEHYKKDPKVLRSARAQFLKIFSLDATHAIIRSWDQYQCDVLVLHGEDDVIVPIALSEAFISGISSESKQFIRYPNLYHEILNENEKETVFKDIFVWLNHKGVSNHEN